MNFDAVRLCSVVGTTPPEEITSADIEQRLAPLYERLKLPAGRLELMTGIHARRFWPGDPLPSAVAAEAGARALSQAAMPPERIDLLVHCAVCRDRLEPATAAYVHQLLALPPHCQIFDLSSACLGFLNGMVVAAGLIQARQIEAALLVAGENGRPLLERTLQTLLATPLSRQEIKPYFANLTIGAGAAAAILCHESLAPQAPRLLGAVAGTDSHANHLCQGDRAGDGLDMLTESELLLEAGIQLATSTWQRFTSEFGGEFSRVICHQVGRTHQRRLLQALALDPSLDYPTYPHMGNVGSVSLPYTLARAQEAGALAGRAALLGIGSGLASLMLALQWS